MTNKKLVVIIGPTSSGKTSAALKLCQKFDGEIISADSRQIYKYLDIGTGKVPVYLANSPVDQFTINRSRDFWEIAGIEVWMYGVVKPGEYFSADSFRKQAQEKIAEIWSRHKVPFVVGGTGFYVEALLGQALTAQVPPDFRLRKNLETLTTLELSEKLKKLDPKRYDAVDKNNRRRLIRAVEIVLSSNPPVYHLKPVFVAKPLLLRFVASHDFLYPRADAWVETVFKKGLIEETKELVEMGYKSTPQLQGLIYKTVLQHLDDKLTLEEAKQRIKFDLHSYIRRQETYFRKMSGTVQVDITEQAFDEKLRTRVESYLNG